MKESQTWSYSWSHSGWKLCFYNVTSCSVNSNYVLMFYILFHPNKHKLINWLIKLFMHLYMMFLRQWYLLFRYTAALKFRKFRKRSKKLLILWNIIAIWNNNFLFYSMLKFNLFSKAEFSASLLQSLVTHDPSEINNQCWKQLSCLMFLGPMWSFFHYSLINKKVKKNSVHSN